MKDLSSSSGSKQSGHPALPKKRSPYGVQKSHGKTPGSVKRTPAAAVSVKHTPAVAASVRRTPAVVRAEWFAKRERARQVAALQRKGVLIEEEYRDDITLYMHEMEEATMGSTGSMDQQPEIKWHMRPCLSDFLIEIHFSFRLRPETLYLCQNIIDRYVSRRIVFVKHYQLVGCTALWLASKFEDAKERVPTVYDLVQVCRETYEDSAFLQMERHMLNTIEWTLGHPTAEAWLRLSCTGLVMEEAKVQHVARFLMETTLFYREYIQYPSSAIALGSLCLARYICGKGRLVEDETKECLEVVDLLDGRFAKHVNDLSEVLIKKYSYAFFSKASTFVVQYYLQGGRFSHELSTYLPTTPTRSSSSATFSTPVSDSDSSFSTPMSASTSASDLSDDMPATPTSPEWSSDTFAGPYVPDNDKENAENAFEAAVKHVSEPVPEDLLPHDFVAYSRQALHSLNCTPPPAQSSAA
ncbi:hypothetical protein OE88DRAFT_1618854 [Heliocybe sulcata]|uniref:Uncharacterized protein n=1 Tax=Heliocybe sulcata TaxID=5364 RepID=A0A5C3NI05_9AGAM|nr:hypothetical protein OE88DRAFT_1618854 [Heliocybe sulcata]